MSDIHIIFNNDERKNFFVQEDDVPKIKPQTVHILQEFVKEMNELYIEYSYRLCYEVISGIFLAWLAWFSCSSQHTLTSTLLFQVWYSWPSSVFTWTNMKLSFTSWIFVWSLFARITVKSSMTSMSSRTIPWSRTCGKSQRLSLSSWLLPSWSLDLVLEMLRWMVISYKYYVCRSAQWLPNDQTTLQRPWTTSPGLWSSMKTTSLSKMSTKKLTSNLETKDIPRITRPKITNRRSVSCNRIVTSLQLIDHIFKSCPKMCWLWAVYFLLT